MATVVRGVILVGHGGIPKGCLQELITKLKRLEAQRRATKMPPSPEKLELDSKIRQWPRTPETGPYQSGLEAVTRGAVGTYTSGLLVFPTRASICALA